MNKMSVSTERVTQTLKEEPEEIFVRIKTEYSPLINELWNIADNIDYKSDLIHDALKLARAKSGDKYFWGYDVGTHMFQILKDETAEDLLSLIVGSGIPRERWYLIEITRIDNGVYACGFLNWLNADSWTKMLEVIKHQRQS